MRLVDAFLAEVKRQQLELPGELVIEPPHRAREGRLARDLPVEYRKYIAKDAAPQTLHRKVAKEYR